MFFTGAAGVEFGAVKKKKAPAKKPISKKVAVKKKPAPKTISGGASLDLNRPPRVVALEARGTFNQTVGNASETRGELLQLFESAGWEVVALSVKKDALFYNDVTISIELNVNGALDAESVRQSASRILQDFTRWWITGNFQVFQNIQVKILKDYQTEVPAPQQQPTRTPAGSSPTNNGGGGGSTRGGGDSIGGGYGPPAPQQSGGGDFLGSFGFGLGGGLGTSTPIVLGAAVLLVLIAAKK